jgi:type VI secretion system protein ImpG
VIESIIGLNSERVVDWCGGEKDGGFCRGIEVVITMDEGRLIGTGAMLFASVIERFLGLYTTINSFTRLVAKVRNNQGDTELRRWLPRSGEHPMI